MDSVSLQRRSPSMTQSSMFSSILCTTGFRRSLHLACEKNTISPISMSGSNPWAFVSFTISISVRVYPSYRDTPVRTGTCTRLSIRELATLLLTSCHICKRLLITIFWNVLSSQRNHLSKALAIAGSIKLIRLNTMQLAKNCSLAARSSQACNIFKTWISLNGLPKKVLKTCMAPLHRLLKF